MDFRGSLGLRFLKIISDFCAPNLSDSEFSAPKACSMKQGRKGGEGGVLLLLERCWWILWINSCIAILLPFHLYNKQDTIEITIRHVYKSLTGSIDVSIQNVLSLVSAKKEKDGTAWPFILLLMLFLLFGVSFYLSILLLSHWRGFYPRG